MTERRLTRTAVALTLAIVMGACSTGSPDRRPAGSATSDRTSPSEPAASAPASPSGAPDPGVTESGLDPSAASGLASAAQAQVSQLPTAAPVTPVAPVAPRQGAVLGADISWPQCPPGLGIEHKISTGAPLPRPATEFTVIGLTNGPGFHANPCLADQVDYARQRGLLVAAYSVISQPDAAALTQYGGPQAAGYAQALFNVASMRAAGLTSPIVWLDVEPVPFYDWGTDVAANAQVVRGAARGYRDAGYAIGVYSTPYLWRSEVGDLTLGDVPEWRAAGQTSRAEARTRCGPDWVIQGGQAALGQWVQSRRDRDVTCPGQAAQLGRYFARLS